MIKALAVAAVLYLLGCDDKKKPEKKEQKPQKKDTYTDKPKRNLDEKYMYQLRGPKW